MADALSEALPRITRRDPVAAEVARRLLDFLVSGEVAAGQRIPSERDLAQALGVGRSAIREGLKHLQLLGLLDTRVGDGTYLLEVETAVVPQLLEWGLLLRADKVTELAEARRYIEVALAGLAAERRDDQHLNEIRGHLEEMRSARKDLELFGRADAAFHFAVADAAQNRVLASTMSNLRSLLRVWIGRVLQKPTEIKRALVDHQAIFTAIERGDRQAAETAMASHIDRVASALRESLSRDSPDQRPVA